MSTHKFLKTKSTRIVDADGKPVMLRGLNLGGWLMMEAYFMHSPNLPERKFKKEFKQALGAASLKEFEDSFRNTFIQEKDIKHIKSLGFNCLRVPFNYRLIETKAYTYDKKGLGYLDRVVKWATKYKIWIILDLHAAPGCQNHDWHSDSYGKAELWTKESNRKRTYALWKFLANRYKDEPWIAGYDLLNESVMNDTKLLNLFYKELIQIIRSVDHNHILFIEGNNWSMDLDCLDEIKDDNYVLSIHHYIPLEFTFNFVPHMSYPLKGKEGKWDKQVSKQYLKKYDAIAKKRKAPIFVGEFGVNYRDGLYNEHKWLEDTLSCFDEYNFHWTYWPYKAIKNNAFPDGVYSYYPNPKWVCREGPVMGWDTYKKHWKEHKKAMTASWDTSAFSANIEVLKVLQKHV